MADNAEHLERLQELIELHTSAYHPALHAAIRALSPAAAGVPVKYVRWHQRHGFMWNSLEDASYGDETGCGWSSVPLFLNPQPQGVVGDEMVERAVYAFTHFSPVHSDDAHAMMRAALTAALHPPTREAK